MIRYVLVHNALPNILLFLFQDLSVNVFVRPEVGATELLRQCTAALKKEWDEWSFGHDLPEKMVRIECKGVSVTAERDCLLQHFAKKPRGRAVAAATKQYDFSTILDIYLVIKSSFYDLVCEHQTQVLQASESGVHEVCEVPDQDRLVSHFSTG